MNVSVQWSFWATRRMTWTYYLSTQNTTWMVQVYHANYVQHYVRGSFPNWPLWRRDVFFFNFFFRNVIDTMLLLLLQKKRKLYLVLLCDWTVWIVHVGVIFKNLLFNTWCRDFARMKRQAKFRQGCLVSGNARRQGLEREPRLVRPTMTTLSLHLVSMSRSSSQHFLNITRATDALFRSQNQLFEGILNANRSFETSTIGSQNFASSKYIGHVSLCHSAPNVLRSHHLSRL